MMPESYGLSVNRSYMAERKDFMAFLVDNRISGWSTVEDATSDTLTFFMKCIRVYANASA